MGRINHRSNQWAASTTEVREDILFARELLKETVLSIDAIKIGLGLIEVLQIDSHRAEFTMFEAARAYAASDGRTTATVNDIRAVAPMALRLRRSPFMTTFFDNQKGENNEIQAYFDALNTV